MVFLRIPVAKLARLVPLIFETVIAKLPAVLVASPVCAGSAAVGRVDGRLKVPAVSYNSPVLAARVGNAMFRSLLTVVASDPAVLVTSPVSAGMAVVGRVVTEIRAGVLLVPNRGAETGMAPLLILLTVGLG